MLNDVNFELVQLVSLASKTIIVLCDRYFRERNVPCWHLVAWLAKLFDFMSFIVGVFLDC